jgi:hypothetical protein
VSVAKPSRRALPGSCLGAAAAPGYSVDFFPKQISGFQNKRWHLDSGD